MIENIIARRYARGLAEYAREKDELAAVRADMEVLADVLDPDAGEVDVPEVLDFLRSPTIPVADKEKITDVLCEKLSIGKSVSDFLNVLIRKNRTALAGRIAREFDKIAADMEDLHTAHVITARPLSDARKAELEAALGEASGRKVRLSVREDPALRGGLRVRLGDTLLDGSLSHRLERLGERLA